MTDVAIVGAGPYGLSIAAHLRAMKVDARIFGNPMHTWISQMPQTMRLKSEGFASSLYDAGSSFTLGHYCRERNIEYADIGLPVSLETFTAYGLEFQKKMVPHLENHQVTSIEKTSSGFELRLDSEKTVLARRVVLAAGISHFHYLPPSLASLPEELVTHAAAHSSFERFRGRKVIVLGAGASALDVAAALVESGADVQLLARRSAVRFHNPPGKLPRPMMERIQAPMTGLGPGWRSWFCTQAPLLFHRMPQDFRVAVAKRHLGPAPGWFVRSKIDGKIPFHLSCKLKHAKIEDGRLSLAVENGVGDKTLVADHLIAATGYRTDLSRLRFLSPSVRANIQEVNQTPILSTSFESSVPGLYFVGLSSANSFGPLVRFAYGAKFTSRRISRHLSRARKQP